MIPPRLSPGQPVRVDRRGHAGHCRTPLYLKGKQGVVETLLGAHRNPEQLAYHKPGFPRRHLYRVRFRQTDVWADYDGADSDTLCADLYEHWLIPLDKKSGGR